MPPREGPGGAKYAVVVVNHFKESQYVGTGLRPPCGALAAGVLVGGWQGSRWGLREGPRGLGGGGGGGGGVVCV